MTGILDLLVNYEVPLGQRDQAKSVYFPINENYYLVFTMDFDQYDFDQIITGKIIPLIQQEKEKFLSR